MRRTNHWLVCDRDPLHQFGPAQTVTDLLMRARMAGWRVGFEGRDVCGLQHEDRQHEDKRDRCTQCGKPWSESACGPTHAILAHERGVA